MSSEKTFLLELRDQAKNTSHEVARGALRDAADSIEYAIKQLVIFPSHERMQVLNCAWSRALRLSSEAINTTPTSPLGGAAKVEPYNVTLAKAA